jgi:putative FmdB family regulatory protein
MLDVGLEGLENARPRRHYSPTMPIYEYTCKACGETAEILQKISDPPEKKCPACDKAKLQKMVSAAGFRLAGGGWYETDFKTDKDSKKNLVGKEEAPAAAAPAASEASGATAKATKSEAKSEAKPKADNKAGKKGKKAAAKAA